MVLSCMLIDMTPEMFKNVVYILEFCVYFLFLSFKDGSVNIDDTLLGKL
jgi:hypothetical protein